ncbi:MAG: hypothetical protein COA79_11360 [Planctomycetota bacterium]|nr:MAG: hypothetical protein COA79_11360 [Planctomycetota bacterium]
MIEKITVFILTYNRPVYLEQCLTSLRGQSYKNFKTVVLDNCSDQSLEYVISEFSDLNIEYIKHKSNLGSTGNFTYAWKHVKTTDYFVVFHDDDQMHSKFLELELGLLESNSDLKWVASSLVPFRDTPPTYPLITEVKTTIMNGAELALKIIHNLKFAFSSVMYRSNTIKLLDLEMMIKSYSIILDRPILLELVMEGKCAMIHEPLILYRCHDEQDSLNGPISEDNLQNVFVAFKKSLASNWTPKIEKTFYSWTGFQLVDGHKRLGKSKKSAFNVYLKKAKAKGIYKDRFYYYYVCGYVKTTIQYFFQALKLFFTNPRRFFMKISHRMLFIRKIKN